MNFIHLHLILTHFPPVLSLGGALSAAAGLLLPRRRRDAVHLALGLLMITGAMMPMVYIAGERAADSIGRVEGIQQEAIAPHQAAAIIALSVSMAAAAIATVLLIVERRRGGLSTALCALLMLAAFASATAIGWTAFRGGAIHHPEIHSAEVVTPDPPLTSWTSSVTAGAPVAFPFASTRG